MCIPSSDLPAEVGPPLPLTSPNFSTSTELAVVETVAASAALMVIVPLLIGGLTDGTGVGTGLGVGPLDRVTVEPIAGGVFPGEALFPAPSSEHFFKNKKKDINNAALFAAILHDMVNLRVTDYVCKSNLNH